MRLSPLLGLSSLLITALAAAAAEPVPFPSLTVPTALGVNIHFTDPKPGEMDMLAAAGFRWVRMDFNWGGTERKPGEYDFAAYDHLMAALDKHAVRPVFILDYANRLYDNGLSPSTGAGRAAFAKWAAAAATHFANRGVVWEMYNEPNIGFWKPKPDVDAYAKLALAVGKALRDAAPAETYVGPATSTIDLKFIEACFKAGCLEYWSAVSVHPYRQSNPETAAAEYQKLRLLIARYNPHAKPIPILSGEWGYSSAWQKFDEDKQDRYLPRELLTNLWQEVPISIWYDWHDDGTDPKEPEHHFGAVHNAYRPGQPDVYEPKPAYRAMRTLGTQLGGYTFSKRLALDDPRDFLLLFEKSGDTKLAAWTTANEDRKVSLPTGAGEFTVVGHLGDPKPNVTATDQGIAATLTGEVQYFTPAQPNDALKAAAAWPRLPIEIVKRGPDAADGITRDPAPKARRVTCPGVGMERFVQETSTGASNPLFVTVVPISGNGLTVLLRDPSAQGLKANVTLTGMEAVDVEHASQPFELKPGQTDATLRFPAKAEGADYSLGVQVTDDQGRVLVEVPQANFGGLADFADEAAYRLDTDGDKKVASTATLTKDVPLEAAPEPGMVVLKLAYKTDPGWKFWQVKPTRDEAKKIAGQPRALGLWIWGSGKNELPRLRFTDSTGQTFQAAGETIDWHGWRFVTVPMDAAAVAHSHWGGANDGVIHYPIKWDTLFLLDRDSKKPADGAVFLAGATLIR